MASGGAVRAGRAFVEMFLDDSKLQRGLKRSARSMKRFGNNIGQVGKVMMAAGAAIVAPIAVATRSFAKFGDSIAKISRRTGVSAEALSELKFAAEQSGSSLQDVEKAMKRSARVINDAGNGLASAQRTLDQLGIDTDQIQGKSVEDQFNMIAEGLAKITDESKRAAVAQEIFGRAGTSLIPMMANGVKGMEKLRQEARDLGLIVNADDAKNAEELTDAMNRVKLSITAVALQVGAAIGPALVELSVKMIKVIRQIMDFVKENRTIIPIIVKVGLSIAAAGAAFIIAGAGIALMGSALAGISTIAATVASVISAIPAILAAIFSPIGLIVAAVVAVGIAIVKFTGIWDTAVNVMKSKWATLVAVFQRGGFVAAIKVAWAQIQLLFAQGSSAVLGAWINMTAKLKTIWVGFSSSVRLLVFELVNGIIDGFLGLSGAVQKIINQLRGKFDKGFDVTLANVGVDNAVSELGEMAKKALGTDTAESEKRREKALSDIESKRASGIAELDANVAKARENLSKAIKDGLAKTKTAEEATKKAAPTPDTGGSGGTLPPKLGGVSGTFSGAVARMLGADPNEKKNRKANEQTAEETRRTNALLRTRTVLLK